MPDQAQQQTTIPAETPLLSASSLLSQALTTLQSSPNAAPTADTLHQLQLSLDILTKLDPYLDAYSTPPPASLQPLIDATIKEDWDAVYAAGKTSFPLGAQFSAGAYEGVLVSQITRAVKAKRVLEVGMFTGTTTLCIADQLKQSTGGQVVALEIDDYLKEFVEPHLDNAGLLKHVDVRTGPASDSIARLVDAVKQGTEQPFDLIFIDADKGGYKGYFDQILDGGLLSVGGVILVDNTLYKGTPLLKSNETATLSAAIPGIKADLADAVREFNEYIRKDSRVDVSILPIRDGITWVNRVK